MYVGTRVVGAEALRSRSWLFICWFFLYWSNFYQMIMEMLLFLLLSLLRRFAVLGWLISEMEMLPNIGNVFNMNFVV